MRQSFLRLLSVIFALFVFSAHARLNEPGWNPYVRAELEKLIDAKRYQGAPVVFDFDNTLVCRDIGEATLGVMVRDRILTKETLPLGITPIDVPGGDLVDVYETFLDATKHHVLDKAPYLNAYAWLVQIMAGLTPQQILNATKTAYGDGIAIQDMRHPTSQTSLSVTPERTSYRMPYFYPEMVELVAEFIENGYDVWVISASNAWTIRWMISNALNPLLHERGVSQGIRSDRVIGISTLLHGPENKLYKDPFLALEKRDYASLNENEMSRYTLTTHIVYPMSAHYGKAANILQWIGQMPYFVAGDSPNDHGMLSIAEHRLWITRLENPAYQRETIEMAKKTGFDNWLFQPTLTKVSSGFVSGLADLSSRVQIVDQIAESLQILQATHAFPH